VLTEGSYRELQAYGVDFAKLLGSSDGTTVGPNGEARSDVSDRVPPLHGSTESILSLADENKLNGAASQPQEEVECRSFGRVTKRVYTSYLSAAGSACKVSFCLLMYVIAQVLITGGDYWISFWYGFRVIDAFVRHDSQRFLTRAS